MKVLLDECLPKRLKLELPEHEVKTVPEMGWAGKKNGELLALATGRFDCFLTIDRGLAYQQNLAKAKIPIIVMSVTDNRLESFQRIIPKVRQMLKEPVRDIVTVS